MLLIMSDAFKRKLRIPFIVKVAFGIIDFSLIADLEYLRLIDLPAIHPASGMFGINEMVGMAVDDIGGSVISTCAGILAGGEINTGKKNESV
jgi:hypothetical protein